LRENVVYPNVARNHDELVVASELPKVIGLASRRGGFAYTDEGESTTSAETSLLMFT